MAYNMPDGSGAAFDAECDRLGDYDDDYPVSDSVLRFTVEVEKDSRGWDITITHPNQAQERVLLKVWANAASWVGERIMVMADALERAK